MITAAWEGAAVAVEEPLSGGNTTVVVRVGDTVRRPVGPWTPAVHDLLNHLAEAGFDGSPRVLGVDDAAREVLRFVPGEVGTLSPSDPLPRWFRTEEACWAVGRWVREFQRAQAGLRLDTAKPWRRAPGGSLGDGQVVVHHDVSPYNTVRRDDGSLVVLDWDFARPGDPIEDLAWAAWRWVPLMSGTWWHAEYGIDDTEEVEGRHQRNLAALLDGYGPSARQRLTLAAAVAAQMTGHAADLEEMARTDPAFARLVERDYARLARADAAWWVSSGHRLRWRA
ncbi:phosphotransferase [Angustibacter sp. Root456]|uniref:phosphotransferase n=1 Tax=Angustibacter sp. Root456 TaxID=1736539 RepID=UPI0012F99FEA|nr:phosphotransferase [Angustibacter sp. Root456]